jgi:hypothetical protein
MGTRIRVVAVLAVLGCVLILAPQSRASDVYAVTPAPFDIYSLGPVSQCLVLSIGNATTPSLYSPTMHRAYDIYGIGVVAWHAYGVHVKVSPMVAAIIRSRAYAYPGGWIHPSDIAYLNRWGIPVPGTYDYRYQTRFSRPRPGTSDYAYLDRWANPKAGSADYRYGNRWNNPKSGTPDAEYLSRWSNPKAGSPDYDYLYQYSIPVPGTPNAEYLDRWANPAPGTNDHRYLNRWADPVPGSHS